MVISWWGALIGLALAIYLILKKLNPVYSLMLGAIIGALLGGASLTGTGASRRSASRGNDGIRGCRNLGPHDRG